MNLFEYLSNIDFKNQYVKITLNNGEIIETDKSYYSVDKLPSIVENKINGYVTLTEDKNEHSFMPNSVCSISLSPREYL